MASIRERNGRWQARVIRTGYDDEVRTFQSRVEAERWVRKVEVEIDTGFFAGFGVAESTPFSALVERYIVEVVPSLKGREADRIRLRALLRNPMMDLKMSHLTAQRLARFRDDRLRQVSASTVIRELAYLSAIINHARKEWGMNLDEPGWHGAASTGSPGRDRVLSAKEEVQLMAALEPVGRRSPFMKPLVVLALETAMRRGELLALRWGDIDLERRIARLHTSKNNEGRFVPLSRRAVQILSDMAQTGEDRVFPIKHPSVSQAFGGALERSGLEDLRFHDLRHTAITRIAAKIPNLIELSAISGHKSLSMLKRYYHPRAEDLAIKLG